MNKPIISEKFDMNDIRNIRDFNSERHSKMTGDEVIADINNGAKEMLKFIEERRKKDGA